MRILGTLEVDGPAVADFELAHGDDPARALARRGFALDRPTEARSGTGGIELVALVRPIAPVPDQQTDRDVPRDAGVPADVIPVVRQRIAAYALVTSERGLLATQFSDRTRAEGDWGLPGGGIDDGEEPTDAVLREIEEETSQPAVLEELIGVDSARWIGPNPRGVVEDYHTVRLIYRAHCPTPGEPVVLDVGGTTASARWIELAHWSDLNWSPGWRRTVAQHLSPSTGSGPRD